MKRIGILGCGWLGLPLAKTLLTKDIKIKGTTTSPSKIEVLQGNDIEAYTIDLYEDKIDELDTFLKNIDCLIITIPPFRGEEEPTYAKNFKKLLPFIEKHNIKNVIMMSSVSIYAPSNDVITEEFKEYSQEPTAKQILDAENVLLNAPLINTCILRLGGLYGEDRRPVNYICRKELLDNPDMPINMIHLDDIIQFTVKIINKGFEGNHIYNIVSPSFKSRFDYYNQQAKECNLILPPNGSNDLSTFRRISGTKIAKDTDSNYLH